jgi:beta-fructofuranosidase
VRVQSIPRTVLLDTKTGSNLLQWPVVEVENLRMSGKRFDDVALDRGSVVPLDVGKATQVKQPQPQPQRTNSRVARSSLT